jgi:hypothetical protein
VSVLKDWRGLKVGDALMQAVIGEAEKRGLKQQMLSAQVQATAFYERLGFSMVSEEFLEAGIPHVDMVRHSAETCSEGACSLTTKATRKHHKTPRHVRMPGRFAVYDSTCPIAGRQTGTIKPLIAEITDMSLRTLLTTLLVTCSFSVMAATEIVPLNYRTSADMLPVAQDFIGKDGQVSAYGNQLIVNADQRKIDELKALLSQLDTAPKRLLITVDTSDNNTQGDQGYSVNGANPTRPASSVTAPPAAMAACSKSRPAKARQR